MKPFLTLFILLSFFINISVFGYDDDDHMYMTLEAYYLLKNQNHCFPEMEYRLGSINDFGGYAWQMGKITTGAYREDAEDVQDHGDWDQDFEVRRETFRS